MHNRLARKGISVVIPNYNGSHLFPETLPTIFAALKQVPLSSEVIVCDDGSTDNSICLLQTKFPEVKIVVNEKNSGFSITANKGVSHAEFDLVLLVNSDVKLEPDYFNNQLKYFEKEDTFGVMGRIIGWTNDIIQDGAKYPSFHGLKIKTSGNYLLANEYEMRPGLYTMYISGANAFFDKSKFLQIGGFNEMFSPFYVEDYELSLRAWRYGWKCYYDHQSICRHQISVTIQSKNKKNYIRKIYNRNKMFLHAIHLNGFKRFIWFLQVIFEIAGQTLLLKTFYLKAFILFVKNYRLVRTSRELFFSKACRTKILSVEEVINFIITEIKDKRLKFF